jgi:methyl-accepting chemotaxis protein
MKKKDSFLSRFFLSKYSSASFMSRQKARIFMWMQIIFVCLIMIAQTATNVLSPDAATQFYNISMGVILAGFLACLFILKAGAYRIAAYSGIMLPLFIIVAQAMQVNTITGKFVYLLYLVIFIVMAALFGNRVTIVVITTIVIAAGVLVVLQSGDIIPSDRHGSSIANFAIVSIFISTLCMLIFRMVRVTLNEAETKKSELERTLDEINAILRTSTAVAGVLNDMADVLSDNAGTFSRSAQTQAAGVEEISATMEEMLSAVNQNADHAAEAEMLSEKSYRLAVEGTEIVNRAVGSIHDVNESSTKISEIIGMINDIAFQTNLLALNASVEAARAGASGRGFAVVAAEVRNLAVRSREASDEINRLIKTSVEKVAVSTDLVNKSGASLKEIFASIEQTRKIIAQINSVSGEQKDGIGQITVSLNQADTVSQQTASAAEELFSSSEEIKKNSEELKQLMAFSKVQ